MIAPTKKELSQMMGKTVNHSKTLWVLAQVVSGLRIAVYFVVAILFVTGFIKSVLTLTMMVFIVVVLIELVLRLAAKEVESYMLASIAEIATIVVVIVIEILNSWYMLAIVMAAVVFIASFFSKKRGS
jgi:hypothetical protein